MKAHIAIFIASLAIMTSCEKMFKPKTVGEVENDVMWTVPDMAKGVLMGVYNDIPKRFDSFSGNYLDAATATPSPIHSQRASTSSGLAA